MSFKFSSQSFSSSDSLIVGKFNVTFGLVDKCLYTCKAYCIFFFKFRIVSKIILMITDLC